MKNYFYKLNNKDFNLTILLFFIFVIIASLYVGSLLFGKNSLDVLMKLEEQERKLNTKIDFLLLDNARLQKEYFELKNLEN